MKKFIAPLICGFGAGVLMVVPVIKSFSCCLIIPIAAFLALFLDQRANNNFGKIAISKGLVFGLITGLVAAFFGTFFDVMITFITKSNEIVVALPEFRKVIADFPISNELKQEALDMMQSIADSIKASGFSAIYTFSTLLGNLFVNSVFGIIGGMVGAAILNSRNKNNYYQQ